MAVHPHYPPPTPSPPSRSTEMWPSQDNPNIINNGTNQFVPSPLQQDLIGDVQQQPFVAGENAAAVMMDHLQIDATFNPPIAPVMWDSDVSFSPLVVPGPSSALTHQPFFPNQAFTAVPSLAATQVGLQQNPVDQRFRAFNSAGASTSGRPENFHEESGSSFKQEIYAQLRTHDEEINNLMNNYRNMLRAGILETEKRQWKSLIAVLEKTAQKRLREKDLELENAQRRNSELEQKMIHLFSENQMWLNLANQNEAMAINLKANLDQVLLQNAAAEAPLPHMPEMEGYGDSDGTPLPANDALSYLRPEEEGRENLPGNGESPGKKNEGRVRMICKVCNEREISVLVLHCRHLCLCKECEVMVDKCPICHNRKGGSVHIFMP